MREQNTFIRWLNNIYHIAPRITPAHASLIPFLDYVQSGITLLVVHLDGDCISLSCISSLMTGAADEQFFTTPNAKGLKLIDVLGSECLPITKERRLALKKANESVASWQKVCLHSLRYLGVPDVTITQKPALYTSSAMRSLLAFGPSMAAAWSAQACTYHLTLSNIN